MSSPLYFRFLPCPFGLRSSTPSQLTGDLLLAAVFGGIILGIGVGLIIRYGSSLDGTEIVAIILDKRTGFSVGEIVMFCVYLNSAQA